MAVEYISQPQVFLAPITAAGGIQGAVNITIDSLNLTATNVSAENAFFGNLVVENLFLTPKTFTVAVLSSISLPTTTLDLELTGTQRYFIGNFTNLRRGATYTLTNKTSNTLTLSGSPTVALRNGILHKKFWSWDQRKSSVEPNNPIIWNDVKSNTPYFTSWNGTLSGDPYLELPKRTACSVRCDSNFVSVW
jgi:hypothetical protein